MSKDKKDNYAVATLGGGCFWCLEAVYTLLKGVETVASGYTGGTVVNPSYQLVCSGTTGHAEVVQVVESDPLSGSGQIVITTPHITGAERAEGLTADITVTRYAGLGTQSSVELDAAFTFLAEPELYWLIFTPFS